LDKGTLDWLMAGPAWLRYAVELEFLAKQPDVKPVLEDSSIREIIARLKSSNAGIPAIKSGRVHYTETGKAYWDLFFLADIGLQVRDLGLEAEAEEIFRFQSSDGSLTMPPNVRDDYFCMSAILVASLARMGYRDDPRIARYIQAIMRSQLANGGWDCYGDSYGRESCPMDDLNILRLLGQYESYRDNSALNGAIDLLLAHWEERTHLYGFGVGRRFRALQYPAVKYGILRVLDVLALFPYAVNSRSFRSMLDSVHGRAVDGRYTPEMADGAFAAFDFGQTREPSRWLTFIIARIDKHTAGSGGV
jgi:hypothetical protein